MPLGHRAKPFKMAMATSPYFCPSAFQLTAGFPAPLSSRKSPAASRVFWLLLGLEKNPFWKAELSQRQSLGFCPLSGSGLGWGRAGGQGHGQQVLPFSHCARKSLVGLGRQATGRLLTWGCGSLPVPNARPQSGSVSLPATPCSPWPHPKPQTPARVPLFKMRGH